MLLCTIFTSKVSSVINAIAYKSDHTASTPGNAFAETISVDIRNKSGWAYTRSAAYLVYYLPDDDLVYIIIFAALRQQIAHWLVCDSADVRHQRTQRRRDTQAHCASAGTRQVWK